jgi:hypothetical protein
VVNRHREAAVVSKPPRAVSGELVAIDLLGEREAIGKVFTTDRRAFSLYRPARIGRFTIIP